MTVHRLVDRVVEHFPDEVVKPSRADAADIHARPLAYGLQSLEYGDVFRGVVRGCHVYNVRLVMKVLRVLCGCLCFCTILPGIRPASAAPPAVFEEVPVAGGTASLAHLLNVDPVPDRARFMSEMTRLVLDNDPRRSPEILAAKLKN